MFLNCTIDYLQSTGADEERISLVKQRDAALQTFCQTTKRLDTHSTRLSCDWEKWNQKGSHIIAPRYHDLSQMDMLMKCLYGLAPPIRPIAYLTTSPDHGYIFESDGKYYLWFPDMEDLWLLKGAQTDDDALVGLGKQTDLMVAAKDGYKKFYELEDEQIALAREK